MRVTFQAGLDDFTETTYLSLKFARRLVPWYRRITSWAGLFAGLAVSRFVPMTEPTRLILALVIGIALIALDEFFYRKLIFKRTRDFYIRKHGHQIPAPIAVELAETGLVITQFNQEHVHPWPETARVVEEKDVIRIIGKNGSVASVRNRGFQNENERKAFLNQARVLVDRASGS